MNCKTEQFLVVILGFIFFVFLGWFFLGDLQLMEGAYEEIPSDKSQAGTHNNNQQPELSLMSSVESPISPAPSNAKNAESQKQYNLDKRRYRIELLTFIAVIFYADVTYQLLQTSRATNEDSRKALEISDRAYVNVREAFMRQPLAVAQPLPRVFLSYENTGHLPASHFCIDGGVVIKQRPAKGEIRSERPKEGFTPCTEDVISSTERNCVLHP